MQNIFAVFHQ